MVKFSIEALNAWFGKTQALKDVAMSIHEHEILSIIGPSNSGKTSFLRMLNRLNDEKADFRMDGRVLMDGEDIRNFELEILRRKVGMVFALPLPLPLSIYDNVAYGPRMHGAKARSALDHIVERALMQAFLWDEVKNRLKESAFKLSGGQQQRLCIARTLAVDPEVILFDEPCSGLDPISTAKVEEAMTILKKIIQLYWLPITLNRRRA